MDVQSGAKQVGLSLSLPLFQQALVCRTIGQYTGSQQVITRLGSDRGVHAQVVSVMDCAQCSCETAHIHYRKAEQQSWYALGGRPE